MTKKNLNWQTRKLGDKEYFTILGSGIEKFEGEKEYISTSCIEMNKIIKKECKITYQKRPSRANMQPRLNSVWFARMKNTVKVYSFTNENEYEINKYILSTGFAGILCNSEVIFPKYVEKIFLSEEFNNLKDSIAGDKAIQKSLNNKDIENLEIPLPPLNVQEKIVKILDTIQEAVEIQGKIIERTKELKKSLMAELFKYGAPSFRKGRKPKKTEIGEIPENWQVVKLGDNNLFDVKGGKRLPKGHNFAENKTPYPYIRVVDFKNGSVDTTNIKYLLPEDYEILKNYFITNNDIYISIAGTIGLAGVIPDELDGAILTENAAKLIIKDITRVYKKFLANSLSSYIGQSQIKALTSKSTQPKLGLYKIKQIKIPLPPLPEQREIAEILKTIDEKIEIEQKKKEIYEELFKTLLNKIMSQEIDVEKVEI